MKTRDLLNRLGFSEVYGEITEKEPSYLYDFGNLQLRAAQVTNFYLQPVFFFGGVAYGNNTLSHIQFEIQLEVESFELGVALIAHGIGRKFKPVKPTPWLEMGRSWQDHLPWVRRQKAYAARPQCQVDREWFRVATKKMRALATDALEADVATICFDGDILKIRARETILAMPAQGIPWDSEYSISVNVLEALPKRFVKATVWLSVWEGHLLVGNRRLPLLPTSSLSISAMHDESK